MNDNAEKTISDEERKNHRFSFIVGIFIGLAIIVLFAIFFH